MDYAVVNSDGTIQNVIVLEEGADWTPPEGTEIVPLVSGVGMLHTWDGVQFVAPPEIVEILEESISQEVPSVIG